MSPEENFLPIKDVAKRLGVNRCTVWRYLKNPTLNFPRPVKFTAGCVRFPSSEVDAWAATRRA